MLKTIFCILAVCIARGNANGCVARNFGYDSIVCVCNATYCDETPDNDPPIPDEGNFYWYVSSKEGLRLSLTQGQLNNCYTNPHTTLVVDSSKQYQNIFGFGGAFTDSVGMNVKNLSEETQDQLLRQYYTPTGSRYNLGRLPVGGSDFSTRPYTYDDFDNDQLLQKFSLAMEDYEFKIPLMKKAFEMNPDIKFLCASWSAPPWMKTNNAINGFGFLKKEFYQIYADYLIKFMDEYKNNGLDIWAISTGNEPANVFAPGFHINSMGWFPHTVATWVTQYFGPSLAKSQHNETLIIALDDQRFELPWYIDKMLSNKNVTKYISGIGVHWYFDFLFSPHRLVQTHEKHPDKFLLMTEACTGSSIWEYPKVQLGSWRRGERYILSIIESLNHWMIGWVDWNIALNDKGGPNWIKNFVDSPVIVNPETDEFYKQPMYYAIKHFSRFISRGSTRISVTQAVDIHSTAVVTPSKEIVVVLYNKRNSAQDIVIKDVQKGSNICIRLPAFSMHTVIYRQ